jgi:enoyl-CoA hydratase/carnithine racemase
LLWEGLETGFDHALAAEGRGIAGQAHTSDGKEGVAAFLARRAPQFTGV